MLNLIRWKDLLHGSDRRTPAASHGNPADRAGKRGAARTGTEPATLDPLPRAGTTFGELIGWRVWFMARGYLRSIGTHSTIWVPGEPMSGDPGDYDDVGVYAWKLKRHAVRQAILIGGRGKEGRVITIVGRVQMWGEVVEHELGYRAQFAKILSLDIADSIAVALDAQFRIEDQINADEKNETLLVRLRRVYGLTDDGHGSIESL